MILSRIKQCQEFVFVAKYLTERSVNIDVVAKPFRPLWHTTQNFNLRDASDNHLLFAFELESDVEKALIGEPWFFDRHLVLLQHYDGNSSMKDLDFVTFLGSNS